MKIQYFHRTIILIAFWFLDNTASASPSLAGDVRLVGSSASNEGRVEIFHRGEWGTVCDDYWDINEGNVVCTQLGFGAATAVYDTAYFGQGSGHIWLANVQCNGTEARLADCPHSGWNVSYCSHSEDAGVACQNATKSVIGSCSFESISNPWCGYRRLQSVDFNWTLNSHSTPSWNTGPRRDHTTGVGHYIYIETSYPRKPNEKAELMSPILSGVKCFQFYYHMKGSTIGQLNVFIYSQGTRSLIWQQVGEQSSDWLIAAIPIKGYKTFQIIFQGVVGSSYTGDIALDDITVLNTACLDIINGSCTFEKGFCGYKKTDENDFDWAMKTSRYYDTNPRYDHTNLGRSGGHYMYLPRSSYYRHEGQIAQLKSPEIHGEKCVQFYYYIQGSNPGELNVYIDDGTKQMLSWQLSGGQQSSWLLGRLPIKDDLKAFRVIFEGVLGGRRAGNIALDDIQTLSSTCQVQPNNASVQPFNISSLKSNVRLVGDNSVHSAGRVEVFYKGRWGSVCGYFPSTSARVVCRQRGYLDVLTTVQCCSMYGRGTGRIFLQDVRCRGDEPDLTMCSHKGWGVTTCSHSQDVAVICKTSDSLGELNARLNGSSHNWEGFAEVQIGGVWGSIGDSEWDISDADVFCRQVGFAGASAVTHGSRYGSQYFNRRRWITSTRCKGDETSFWQCNYTARLSWSWYSSAAGAECFGLYLVGGKTKTEGLVLFEYQGVNGTICNYGWDINDANVVCRQLGFYSAKSSSLSYSISRPKGVAPVVTNIQCTGREFSLGLCIHFFLHSVMHSCTHSNDVAIVCSNTRPSKSPSTKGSTRGPTQGPTWGPTQGPTKGPSSKGPTQGSTNGPSSKTPTSKHFTKGPTYMSTIKTPTSPTVPGYDVCGVIILNISISEWHAETFKDGLAAQLNKFCGIKDLCGQKGNFLPSDVVIVKGFPIKSNHHSGLVLRFFVMKPHDKEISHEKESTLGCKIIYRLGPLAGYLVKQLEGHPHPPPKHLEQKGKTNDVVKRIVVPAVVAIVILLVLIGLAFLVKIKRARKSLRSVRYNAVINESDGEDEALLNIDESNEPAVII